MTLLIDLYYNHKLPKGDAALANRRNRINRQAEQALDRMQKESAPTQPSMPLEDLHVLIARKASTPWHVRFEFLHQRYKGNLISHWPGDVLQLLAITFPADEPKAKLSGKECYNLFKSIAAMMLHLSELQPA